MRASVPAVLLLALLLQGCGGLPHRVAPVPEVVQGDFDGTGLGGIARASLPPRASSAFRLLPQARHAFEAREDLVARAELAVDAQYYFIAGDASGRGFLRSLEDAAARGVRVRLLVDDLQTAEIDPLLARMARLPNLEVRLFNPFCCARASLLTRFAASPLAVRRLDHRMHNKLLVVDRRLAIAGGRNIADDYFARGGVHEFIDIDALMAGDIVTQLASVFERYWTSEAAWPAQDIFAAAPPRADDTLPAPVAEPPLAVPAQDVLGQDPVRRQLAAGRLDLVPGTAYAFADSPAKALGEDEDYLQDTSVLSRARETILAAGSEVLVVTPYLIPRTRGLAMIASLQHRGVRLRVLTNGAGSNDSLLAHAGYARYRRRMLALGVELHELTSGGIGQGERAGPGLKRWESAARLHAKAFVVDRQTVFIGSANFDPRSSDKNTELGILVESAPLAAQMIEVIEANRRLGAVQVKLAPQGEGLRWVVDDGIAPPRELAAEPGLGLFQRLTETLLLPWVPESLL